MTILHVIAGLPNVGGMAEIVPLLALEQRRLGHTVAIATVGPIAAEKARLALLGGVTIQACPAGWPRAFYFSRRLRHTLPSLIANADVVHAHGCWTFPVWWACRAAAKLGKPLVRSPHGSLDPVRLGISRWKKRAAWLLFEKRCFARATVIHATSEDERAGIERILGRGSSEVLKSGTTGEGVPIRVVPLGVDPGVSAARADREALDRRWPSSAGKRVALFLSRLHPIKGVDLLIEAWGGAERPDWHLLIAGPDEQGMLRQLLKQAKGLGLEERISFCGPVFGAEKYALLASCDLFVLPTRNENFGIVVAEALACGAPVIATKGAPWPELLDRDARCGWWVETGVAPLAEALREAMSLTDEERHIMGENGRRVIEARYRLKTMVEKMTALYERCVNTGNCSATPPPAASGSNRQETEVTGEVVRSQTPDVAH